jgi:hypothetical protein
LVRRHFKHNKCGQWHTNCTKGAGESGKSTVLKQMRLLHTKGFSSSERKQWKVTIFNNLLHAFQVIFGAMEEQEVDFAHETNIVSLSMFWFTTFNVC